MKVKSDRRFFFTSRPSVSVVVKTHSENCPYYAATIASENNHSKLNRLLTERCDCPKQVYVKQIRYREALGTTKWDEAERKAKEWADAHDPGARPALIYRSTTTASYPWTTAGNPYAPSAEDTRLATYENRRVYFVTFVFNGVDDSRAQCLLIWTLGQSAVALDYFFARDDSNQPA